MTTARARVVEVPDDVARQFRACAEASEAASKALSLFADDLVEQMSELHARIVAWLAFYTRPEWPSC